MKNYKLSPQENDYFCVCSVLQAIFRNRGIDFSQRDIASNLTLSEDCFDVRDFRIRSLMGENGFEYSYYPYNSTPFNEPDVLIGDMDRHEGIVGIDSHAYLLIEFKDPELIFLNPADGSLVKTSIYDVLKEMGETRGFFGLVKYIG